MKTIIVIAIFFSIILVWGVEMPTQLQEYTVSHFLSTEIEVKAADIRWRYKIENDKLYRRQYDYTNQCWIGEWELCV